jgi:hypothetical protein
MNSLKYKRIQEGLPHKHQRRLREQHGGTLVEFAIIAPLLFVILFGIIDFGVLLYNRAVITNASREGARFGIVVRPTTRYDQSDISTVVTDYCTQRLVTFGPFDPPEVEANPNGGVSSFGDDLEVRVTWEYGFLALPNLPGIGLNNPVTLTARTVMKYE